MKLDSQSDINRLIIYFFYDKDGIVDRYVSCVLKELQENCSKLIVVCNGSLSEKGADSLRLFTSSILVRENQGFDVWAYKTALDSLGWTKLSEFDEVIMMNHTIMGPVFPLRDMFSKMAELDIDFWGITKYHQNYDNSLNLSCGYIPTHIQSHFIAVRRTLIQSSDFQEYWNHCPEIKTYQDSIKKHEAYFTTHFETLGINGLFMLIRI